MAGRRTLVISGIIRRSTLCALLVAGSACSGSPETRETPSAVGSTGDSVARAKQDSVNRTLPGYVVDSILPVEEEIRRFKSSVGGREVAEFANSTRSREALVARFRNALASSDTATLQSMQLTAREFIDLVYPESQYTRAPYRQSPALVWQQIENNGTAGLARLLTRLGGVRIRREKVSCGRTPQTFGKSTVYSHCTIAVPQSDGSTKQMQLFGPIIERGGRFKFVNYTNDF